MSNQDAKRLNRLIAKAIMEDDGVFEAMMAVAERVCEELGEDPTHMENQIVDYLVTVEEAQ